MMIVDVKCVIGANYGDEGKGAMTSFFTDTYKKSLVVLTNGGPQRGHTVFFNKASYIYHHFGSGTHLGADTYFPETFIVNPILFMEEYNIIKSFPFKVYINSACSITTPFDMMYNQIIESSREQRHGSCGLGIWETVRRSRKIEFTVKDLLKSKDYVINKLHSIRDYYFSLKECEISSDWEYLFKSSQLIFNYVSDLYAMLDKCFVVDNLFAVINDGCHDQVIFENGQGLLLDQSLDRCGYRTTPSKTGSSNVVDILNTLKSVTINSLEICYVTRSYITKHGAGEFKEYCDVKLLGDGLCDYTNVWNEWQGQIRYGKLNVCELKDRINKDFENIKKFGRNIGLHNCYSSVAVTHVDEVKVGCDLIDYLNNTQKYYICSYDKNKKFWDVIIYEKPWKAQLA